MNNGSNIRQRLRRLYAAVAVVAGVTAAASSARAQSYVLSPSQGTLSSIRSSGTALAFPSSDDGTAQISPGFPVPFFGGRGTTLYASTNGLLSVDLDQSDYSNGPIPNAGTPSGFMAPMWDDLAVPSGTSAGVFYQVTGSGSSHVLTVEWSDIAPLNAPSETMTFQVKVYESTGNIEFYYGNRAASVSSWSASIGLEDGSGSVGYAAGCTSASACTPSDVPSGTMFVFVPSSTPPPASVDLSVSYMDSPPTSMAVGDGFSVYYEVENAGASPSSATELAVYASSSPSVTTAGYFLGAVPVAPVSASSYTSGYAAGTIPALAPGTYYLAAIIDPNRLVLETDETNNTLALGTIQVTGGGGAAISILTSSLPDGAVGQPYSAQLQASGASSPSWVVVSGQLPPGLSLSASGLLGGTPSVATVASFTVQASAPGYTPGSAQLSLSVRSGGGGVTPEITTTMLPSATVGAAYTAQVAAAGGTPPYAFQIVGDRPPWLRLSSSGEFSGTPDAAGSFDLLVSVFDSAARDGAASLHLEVTQAAMLELARALPDAVVGQPYSASVVSGGRSPYMFTLTSGSLPNGMSFDAASGKLVGTPTMAGRSEFGLALVDAGGATAMGSLTLTAVARSELRILPGDVVIYTNTNAMAPLSAEGGVAPYSWSIVAGSLQEGLSLDADAGRIVGRVSRVGTATVTFAVADSMGNRAEAEVLVKAQAYRAGGSRGGTSERDSGCSCVAGAAPRPLAALALALCALVGLAGLRRR